MLKVTAKVIFNDIPRLTLQMRGRSGVAVRKTTLEILSNAVESMQGPKSGREYARASGTMHQASAPGEAPAIDYGNLVNSLQVDFPSSWTGIVFTNMDYAPVLEFGGARIQARPFMVPAAEKAWPGFIAAMTEILNG